MIIRLAQDPVSLNPISYGNGHSLQLLNYIYQSLLVTELKDKSIKPLLAVDLPTIRRDDTSSYFTFTIRPEANWDNNSPVTAKDVAFSLKLLHSPLLENERWRAQFDFIQDIQLSPTNPKVFTLVCKGYTPEMKLMTGDYFVLPAYLFDPNGIISNVPFRLIRQRFDSLSTTTTFKSFSKLINNSNLARDTAFIKGSGPYRITKWNSGQIVVLDKKKSWWGNKAEKGKNVLNNNPSRLFFQIIPDNAAAILALKTRQIDVMDNVPLVSFLEMQKDLKYKEFYNFHSPPSYDLVYIGVNGKKKIFEDKQTRQALAHLFNTSQLISSVQGGLATSTVGLVHPQEEEFYNSELKKLEFDPNKAKTLLRLAGWQETTEGWQKTIRGKLEKLHMNLIYRGGNSDFENIALLFKQNALKIGIVVTLQPMESSQIGEKLQSKNFDLFIRTLMGNPYFYNFIPLLHSSNSKEGGGNITGFGTPATDLLLEQIAEEEHIIEKASLLKELQRKMQEESNMIFLYFMKNRIAISKQIDSVVVSGIKPGYDVTRFIKKK
ncbi:hypothetical protein DC20_20285 [Rufibacter tibetensis]|uniref:Solute-binding protein family 5 domain-containing protein n=1 Tax=Rufibacter tibetensis TaxID=512763 RepID=A0A0P0C8F6_9BACT|nr:hypothetical protein DC20_20285 [Rufibacter tibetensis]